MCQGTGCGRTKLWILYNTCRTYSAPFSMINKMLDNKPGINVTEVTERRFLSHCCSRTRSTVH